MKKRVKKKKQETEKIKENKERKKETDSCVALGSHIYNYQTSYFRSSTLQLILCYSFTITPHDSETPQYITNSHQCLYYTVSLLSYSLFLHSYIIIIFIFFLPFIFIVVYMVVNYFFFFLHALFSYLLLFLTTYNCLCSIQAFKFCL